MEAKQHALGNHWFREEIKSEFLKYLKTNINKHTAHQNFQDSARKVERGKFKDTHS